MKILLGRLYPAHLAFVCITILCCSCVSTKKSSIKDDGTQIPPGFGKKNTTLLVIRHNKNSYDKYLEKNFEENYFGKYVIIDREELLDKRYSNLEKYPYVFDEDLHQDYISNGQFAKDNTGHMTRSSDYGMNTYAMFYVQDRATGSFYKTKHGTGSFSAWMRAYIQALEAARQKNEG